MNDVYELTADSADYLNLASTESTPSDVNVDAYQLSDFGLQALVVDDAFMQDDAFDIAEVYYPEWEDSPYRDAVIQIGNAAILIAEQLDTII
jgi:hypothetical protein